MKAVKVLFLLVVGCLLFVGCDTLKGKDGKNGSDGIAGQDGSTGQDGSAGQDGVDGSDGQNGTDGVKGDKGDKGDPGDNQFEVWVSSGVFGSGVSKIISHPEKIFSIDVWYSFAITPTFWQEMSGNTSPRFYSFNSSTGEIKIYGCNTDDNYRIKIIKYISQTNFSTKRKQSEVSNSVYGRILFGREF